MFLEDIFRLSPSAVLASFPLSCSIYPMQDVSAGSYGDMQLNQSQTREGEEWVGEK